MGAVRVGQACGLAVCIAAMLAIALPAWAQTERPGVINAPAAAEDSGSRKTKSRRAEAPKRPAAPAVEEKESRHIGKSHVRLRKHAKHIKKTQERDDEDDYTRFVEKLKNDYHLKVLLSPSVMTQWGSPDGGPAATQVVVPRSCRGKRSNRRSATGPSTSPISPIAITRRARAGRA